jgi:hypothetical protein
LMIYYLSISKLNYSNYQIYSIPHFKYEKRMLFLLASLCALELLSNLHTLSKNFSAPAATDPATRSGPPAPPAGAVSDLSSKLFLARSECYLTPRGSTHL